MELRNNTIILSPYEKDLLDPPEEPVAALAIRGLLEQAVRRTAARQASLGARDDMMRYDGAATTMPSTRALGRPDRMQDSLKADMDYLQNNVAPFMRAMEMESMGDKPGL